MPGPTLPPLWTVVLLAEQVGVSDVCLNPKYVRAWLLLVSGSIA